MNVHAPLRLTKAEFRRWVQGRPEHERYELVNGEPHMMVRVRRGHDTIVVNWIGALLQRLDRRKFAIHTGEYAVSTNALSYRLPDVSVGPIQDEGALDIVKPVLLVEVLSPNSLYTDLTEKAAEYLAMPSVQAHAVCAQDMRRMWLFTRADGQWPARPVELFAEDAYVEIPALGLRIPLNELYWGVTLAEA
jgi:Uma2 family endonuclease